jgi:MFS family permease
MTYSIAGVAGPGVAGLAAAAAGPAAAVLGQIGIALIALAPLAALPGAVDGRPVAGGRLGPAMRRGLVHLATVPPLRAVTVATVLEQLPGGLMSVAAAPLAVALGSGSSSGGLLLAAVGAGAAIGAPLLPALRRGRSGLVALVLAGVLAEAAGIALLGGAPGLALGLAAAALTGVPQGLAIAALFAARAEWSPPELRAQVFTSAAGLRTGVYAAGAALAGPALALAGARGATELAAGAGAAAALAGLSAARCAGPRRPAGTSAG